jgi:Nif-specific regulatory protein
LQVGTFLDIYGQEARMDSLREKVREIEKEEIINAMRECKWVMSRAARKLGITERMIGYKIRKYGIRKEEVGKIVDRK